MNAQFWHGKRVLLTGHTGFKGAWMSLWLQKLGANLLGYALPPSSESLFELSGLGKQIDSVHADIRDRERLQAAVDSFRPEIVFHLAAQALVRNSYREPIETYQVNVMGTAHLLEAIRRNPHCRVVVNITSDKCYENKEWVWGYRESDQLGGHDPYSSSKGCAELVTAAYRHSFFEVGDAKRTAVASARAGNVIGGGDFSVDRIVPDFMSAARKGSALHIRSPDAIRPWQHVLEPLHGYLMLAEKLWADPDKFARAWNFGPTPEGIRPVRWIVEKLNDYCNQRVSWKIDTAPKPHEAQLLMLDSTLAQTMLGWKCQLTLEQALRSVVDWYDAYERGDPLYEATLQQVIAYEETCASQ